MSQSALGRVLNVIYQSSAVSVPLTRATAVTYVSFLDAGSQTLTFTQTDSTGVKSPVALNVGTQSVGSENLGSIAYKGPNGGGTWTQVAATGANTFNPGTDAANDTLVVTVRAEQLADGYDSVVCTAGTGTCVALIHDLLVARKPSNLKSSLTA